MKKAVKAITVGAAMMTLVACGGGKANPNIDSQETLGEKEQQLVFEENYIGQSFTYGDGQKFAMSMIANIGTIAAGVAFDSPTTAIGGFFSLLGTINDQLNGSSGPTIADVMSKLSEMDTKLDALNEKLDKNYNQLATETIRTQAMVDQVLLEEQEAAIASFNTNYLMPIENHLRDFADYLDQSYKTYVSTPEVATIYVSKNAKNQWELVGVMDEGKAGQEVLTYNINDFSNSKEFLEKNYNVVSYGFMDNLTLDIVNALRGNTWPTGLTGVEVRDFIKANLIEKFTKQYYTENHQKALDLRNLAINFAKQINGRSTKSIAERYVSRLEYMFNFAGEMKEYVTGAFANMTYELDNYAALAAQACLYAEVNQDEIKTEYVSAREMIKNYYESIKKVNDNYCFVTHSIISGGFYRAQFETSYSNLGNHPTFTSSFSFEKVDYTVSGYFTKDDVNKHNYVQDVDHLRISTRMNLMRENGLVTENSYVRYLWKANVLPNNAYWTYEELLSRKWISTDACRFFTGLSIRDMNDGDKSLKMTCNGRGNPDGDYFYLGWEGNFRSSRDAGCWNGKIAETTYIDGVTGQIQTDKKVAAYATYAESHAYWIDDEYWSFVDNPVGNYFFALEHVAA